MSEKRRGRIEKRKQTEQQSRQQIFMMLFFVGIVVVVGLVAYFLLNQEQPLPELAADFDFESVVDNSLGYEMVGRDHIASDVPRTYNSNPPTSGNHNAKWISPLGVYAQLPDDQLVHNLEHGHVWLSYRDAGDSEALALLTAIEEKYPDRIIVTYRPANDNRIAASAWTRLLVLDELDREQIEAFIIRYSDKAPESILGM
jgi:hypothetical protein